MKKLISALLTAAIIICPFTTTAAADGGAKDKRFIVGGSAIADYGKDEQKPAAVSNSDGFGLPEAYSSVDEGFVTPVKDQGDMNTCTIFSAAGAMESALLKNGYGEYDLSEEYFNYWASTRNDGNGWLRNRETDGVVLFGGVNILSYGGAIKESDLPYMSSDKESFEELDVPEPMFYAGSVKRLSQEDPNEIKRAVMDCGAVATSFYVSDEYLNKQTNAYCCNDEVTDEQIGQSGHAVIIVGWDDNYSRDSFSQNCMPQSNGAWLIKNSWGTGTENFDYMWVSYEDKYISSFKYGYPYAVESIIKKHSCNYMLNIDQFGSMYDMSFDETYVEDPFDVTFINVFDFSRTMPVISSLSFDSENAGSEYEVYYIPVSGGKPVNDKAAWTRLASGNIEYSGLINIPIDDFKVPDECGAIGVRIKADEKASFGCCEWMTQYGLKYIFIPRTADDRSFFISGGKTYSLSDYYTSMQDEIGGNFSINIVANVQRGDINKDGDISLADAILLQKDIADIISLDSDVREYVADTDKNGSVNVSDCIAIHKIIAGIDIK